MWPVSSVETVPPNPILLPTTHIAFSDRVKLTKNHEIFSDNNVLLRAFTTLKDSKSQQCIMFLKYIFANVVISNRYP